jgi:hypothetical protein
MCAVPSPGLTPLPPQPHTHPDLSRVPRTGRTEDHPTSRGGPAMPLCKYRSRGGLVQATGPMVTRLRNVLNDMVLILGPAARIGPRLLRIGCVNVSMCVPQPMYVM